MDSAVLRAEYKEFAKRMDEENTRLSKRISLIEEMTSHINNLALTLKELTVEVKNLTEKQKELTIQQKELNAQIDKIDGRDGEKWRSTTYYVLTAIIGLALGYIAKCLN